MRTQYTFCLAFLLFFSVSTAFAQRITLELFPANSSTPAYAAPIPITSAQYSFANGITGGASGTDNFRTVFTPLVVTKQVDGSTTALQQASFGGSLYQYARLNFYRADGSLGYRVLVGTVFVSNYSASGAEGCTSGCPAVSETITLVYGQVVTYNPADGQIATWDALNNRKNVLSSNIPESAIRQ